MARLLTITRYLIIIPIVGLGLAAAAFFILGVFLALRAWAARQEYEMLESKKDSDPETGAASGKNEAAD